MVGQAHSRLVHQRRVKILRGWIDRYLPAAATSVLDVGSGDGLVLSRIVQSRPGLVAKGIDVLPRAHTHVPVTLFDGRRIPYDDESFDAVMMIDVLHHTDDPAVLLGEARRVARQCILIKDHLRDGWLAAERLKFMDYLGNARYGVALPCVYWTQREWSRAFADLGLAVQRWQTELGLYPWFADWVFGRSLHFVARLGLTGKGEADGKCDV